MFGKHFRQAALQLAQDLLQAAQGDALRALLQTMQGGRRQPELARELRVRLPVPRFTAPAIRFSCPGGNAAFSLPEKRRI